MSQCNGKPTFACIYSLPKADDTNLSIKQEERTDSLKQWPLKNPFSQTFQRMI